MTVNVTYPTEEYSSHLNDSLFTAHVALVFTSVFLGIQTICVALRYVSRYVSKAPWGLDDVLVFASLLMNVGLAALSIGMNQIPLSVQYRCLPVPNHRWRHLLSDNPAQEANIGSRRCLECRSRTSLAVPRTY
jgi:hypothetical protein